MYITSRKYNSIIVYNITNNNIARLLIITSFTELQQYVTFN